MGWIIAAIVIIVVFLFIVILSKAIKIGGTSEQYGQKASIFTPIQEQRGIEGERAVISELYKMIENDEFLLHNLLIPLRNNHTTEIDVVLISRKGIFCIEIKNWVGKIIGNDESEMWIQEYDDLY